MSSKPVRGLVTRNSRFLDVCVKKVGPIHIFLLRLYVTTRDRRDDVHVTSALREREGVGHILIKGREVA